MLLSAKYLSVDLNILVYISLKNWRIRSEKILSMSRLAKQVAVMSVIGSLFDFK